ncbi:MAG: hypothetical protein JO101_02005 [Candidatus Eremiobacteraeota bacterium]|nr:hypothetical protein [Candidatus Eremiobacteraeota bacterium]MBV8354068.1 hypothetical protein [Candidatus Eremiobacteraeota bacterium]
MRSYEQLRTLDQQIVLSLRRFGYTYDSGALSKAIAQSDELASELSKNTQRLAQFRQLVESGASAETPAQSLASPSSLLPLP